MRQFTFAVLCSFITLACVTQNKHKDHQKDDPTNARETAEHAYRPEAVPPLPQVDGSSLSANLNLIDQTLGSNHIALFEANIDARADYLQFKACSTKDPGQCVTSSVCGANMIRMPDRGKKISHHLVFDLPEGKLKVHYKACVYDDIALGQTCSKEKITYFQQGKRPNHKLQKLLLEHAELSQKLRSKSMPVRQALRDYQQESAQFNLNENTPQMEDFNTLVENQLAYNPCKLGALYDFEPYDDLVQVISEAKEQQDQQLKLTGSMILAGMLGGTLMGMGAVGILGMVFGKLPKTQIPMVNKFNEMISTTVDFFGKSGQEIVKIMSDNPSRIFASRSNTTEVKLAGGLVAAVTFIFGVIIYDTFSLEDASPKAKLLGKLDGIAQEINELRDLKKKNQQQIQSLLANEN